MKKSTPKLSTKKPESAFAKPLKADFKSLFKGLAKGIGHATIGKWEELGNDTVETLSAIGLSTEPGELAWLLIQRSIARALFDLVGEIAGQYLTEVKSEASDLEDNLNLSIAASELFIDRKFLESPDKLSLISELQPLLGKWLVAQGVPKAAAFAVSQRLPSYFVYALNQEWRRNAKSYQPLIAAVDTPFTKAGEREWAWAAYASLLNRRIHEGVFDEPFSLDQLYVPLNAYYLDDGPSKVPGDTALRGSRCERRTVVSLQDELEHWLENQDPVDAIRVISGGPGSGKSSFARVFAARLALAGRVRVLFIPLHLIDATKTLVDEVARFTRDEGVLLQNPLDPDSPETNLLVIFDGLDELASQGKAAAETARAFVREVDRTVEKRNLQGPRVRVLISGRELVVQENESEFRRPKQVLNLLPYHVLEHELESGHPSSGQSVEYDDPKRLLKTDLRQEWWRKYGKLSGKGFNRLPEELDRYDLTEITAQPLLNYLVALSFSRGKIDFAKNINLNLIYSDLVAAVYQRGYERKRTYGPIRHMSLDQFSRVLEEVGLAAWHGDGRSTTVKEIEDHCRLSGVGSLLEAFQEGAKVGVTRLLAAFFFRQHGQRATGDPTFVFTHKSFGEYLTARRVIRATDRVVRETEKRQASPDEGWDEKDALRHWVQICGPSAITHYLHTLLVNEVMTRDRSDAKLWQKRLAQLFTHLLRHGMPMEQLQLGTFRESMFRARNAEEAILVVMNACAEMSGELSAVEHSDPTAFGAWFRRVQGQRTSGEPSLVSRCLSFLNLAGVYLDITDLFMANLSKSDLSRVAAHLACLMRADLHGAKLSGARFWRANLTDANLRGADLTEADFEEADLRNVNLEEVRLGTFKVRGVKLTGLTPDEARKQLSAQSKNEQEERDRRMKEPPDQPVEKPESN